MRLKNNINEILEPWWRLESYVDIVYGKDGKQWAKFLDYNEDNIREIVEQIIGERMEDI